MRTRSSLIVPALALAASCASPAPTRSLSAAEVDERISQGRALLDSGHPDEAEAVFASAASADGDSLRTRMWVLRAWMEQGRSNDTLDALDALDRAGEKGPEMAYLYGMAFARRAEGYLAEGVTDSSVQMNFMDATSYLQEAVDADAARFRDAFLPLARSAWSVQQIDTARWAADRAVELYPASAEAWLARGRIAMTQFMAAEDAASGSEAAERAWSDAAESFRRSVELHGTPQGEPERASLALAATQLGHAMIWRQKGPEATQAYARAIAANPQGFDYTQAVQLLRGLEPAEGDERPNGFRAALEAARTELEVEAEPGTARAELGVGSPADASQATLDWWLGWARFLEADWEASEAAFLDSLALVPEYTNAWFYVGLARHYRKDSEGALAAMHTGWDADPAAMVATAAGAGGALRAFEGLIAWCAQQEPARNLDAAFLAEMLAQAMPTEARHWNNLGLFLRDEGERLQIDAYEKKTPEPDDAVLADLYERSYAAYQRALELNPDDPQLVNDAAVMLHYHLGRDLGEAEAMYRRSIELTERLLAQPDLSAEDRARFETTKSDAETNLKRLLDPDAAPEGAVAPEGGAVTGDEASAPKADESAPSEPPG